MSSATASRPDRLLLLLMRSLLIFDSLLYLPDDHANEIPHHGWYCTLSITAIYHQAGGVGDNIVVIFADEAISIGWEDKEAVEPSTRIQYNCMYGSITAPYLSIVWDLRLLL